MRRIPIVNAANQGYLANYFVYFLWWSGVVMDIILSLISQVPVYDLTELILYIVGTLVAAVLIALSVSSYIKTGLIKLKYAIVVFSLFCAFLIYENLEHLFSLDNPFTDMIIPATGLSILLFFFLAVTRKA